MDKKLIQVQLKKWYLTNKRNLPWRYISDPYKVWISEIILQQTRVAQGYDYYLRFIEQFPTIGSLANAPEDEVLKLWQGLGYYSRARNLHIAAKQIMQNHNGIFPKNHADILKLKGIGSYTAAAICSFAYKQSYPVLDGNVFRVLARLFAIETPIDSTQGKKEFTALSEQLMDTEEPDIYNQAIMEFGALQCTPKTCDCSNCILQNTCLSAHTNLVQKLPIKTKKTKVNNRYFNYIVFDYKGTTYLQKRAQNDIWKHLYEFPLIESDRLLSTEELLKNDYFLTLTQNISEVEIQGVSAKKKHVLSHQSIYAQAFTIEISNINPLFNDFTSTLLESIDKYAVSRLIEKIINKEH